MAKAKLGKVKADLRHFNWIVSNLNVFHALLKNAGIDAVQLNKKTTNLTFSKTGEIDLDRLEELFNGIEKIRAKEEARQEKEEAQK